MRYLVVILFSAALFTACQKSQTQNSSTEVRRFPIKGKVISVDRAKKKATIKHEEIPGFMAAMTMPFPIKEDWVWDDLKADTDVFAELVVDANDDYWLEKIGVIAAPDPNQANQPILPPARPDVAQIGNQVPDFILTDQDGKRINFKDYRGKALAITFIYSRCPLPEYCILMSKNFSDLANELKDSELKDKIRLLSVSFDPQTDTPAKLKEYGRGYLGRNSDANFAVWQLATGTDREIRLVADFFGLRYEADEQDKTQFNHSLRTVVVTPEGKVQRVFSGGEWTTEELLRELRETIK